MLDANFVKMNKGRLYWVYVVCRQSDDLAAHYETIRMFFDKAEADEYANTLKTHPAFGKHYTYSVHKTKTVI